MNPDKMGYNDADNLLGEHKSIVGNHVVLSLLWFNYRSYVTTVYRYTVHLVDRVPSDILQNSDGIMRRGYSVVWWYLMIRDLAGAFRDRLVSQGLLAPEGNSGNIP
ncbi:unnamed protein product [Arctogadus glacialis]